MRLYQAFLVYSFYKFCSYFKNKNNIFTDKKNVQNYFFNILNGKWNGLVLKENI